MNKYAWFFMGYVTAFATIVLASCTLSPLEASNSEQGSSRYNPLYVVVVQD